jgi:hypothetical protein
MNLDEKFSLPSNLIIQDNIEKIDMQGYEVFEKKENLWDSLMFGIPLKYIFAGVGLWALMTGKLKNISQK